MFTFKDDIKNLVNRPSPEELEVQKIEKERGAFKNIQAFFEGEASLKPSNKPPTLGSLQKDTEFIKQQLGIPNQANIAVTNKGVIISDKPPLLNLSTTERLTALEALQRNRRKTQKQNMAFSVVTQATSPSTNNNNRIGKEERVSKGEKKPIKKRQRGFRGVGLISVSRGVNENNIVSIRSRRTVNLRQSQGITETNVEIKEVNEQIG